jgi:hypothetical protein
MCNNIPLTDPANTRSNTFSSSARITSGGDQISWQRSNVRPQSSLAAIRPNNHAAISVPLHCPASCWFYTHASWKKVLARRRAHIALGPSHTNKMKPRMSHDKPSRRRWSRFHHRRLIATKSQTSFDGIAMSDTRTPHRLSPNKVNHSTE